MGAVGAGGAVLDPLTSCLPSQRELICFRIGRRLKASLCWAVAAGTACSLPCKGAVYKFYEAWTLRETHTG